MEKLLGANWKTTVSGIAAAVSSLLAMLSTISLTPEAQNVIAFMSEGQKKSVAVLSAIAALVFKAWNSLVQKDRNVTGGIVQQTAKGDVARSTAASSTAVSDTYTAAPES